ncbi:unnamed protein product [Gulo gulo]|uniref:Uncharacterized protein n=1 Tax=Gulo gulo TaxID=48420 RepID=A0A9X9MDI7_GULGU|nr:unnamed protein product [Gulo gulo]
MRGRKGRVGQRCHHPHPASLPVVDETREGPPEQPAGPV